MLLGGPSYSPLHYWSTPFLHSEYSIRASQVYCRTGLEDREARTMAPQNTSIAVYKVLSFKHLH